MSDITATNCGCERDCGCNNGCNNGCNGGCNNGCNGNGLFNFWGGNGNCSFILWILILLACCGNNDGCGCGNNDNNYCLILLILLCCGGCGNGCF